MGEEKLIVFVGKPEGKSPILSWILERENGVLWAGSIWLRIGISGGLS
jgi:hypothetical protein